MAALVCDLCGGKLVMHSNGVAVCDSCGMEHGADRMKEKIQEVKGIVQVDNSHLVANYLDMALNAVDAGNNAEAEAYCNKIIEVEPANYKAWILKGEAAIWQSTLAKLRINEGINAFTKGINYAPKDAKKEVVEQANKQIKSFCIAIVKRQAERFAKWPDKEETTSLISMLTTILNTVINFLSQTNILVPIGEIMGPVATLINQSVIQAWQNVIYPQYKSERNPYPDKNDFIKFIDRIGYCTTLIEKAIAICDTDDEDNIQRYENLIYLQKEAINSCSYDWEYANLEAPWIVEVYRQKFPGCFPVASENRVYYKKFELDAPAIASRRNLIAQYEAKIKELKSTKEQRIAAEKAEKKRKAKEEAKKRFDHYWSEHASEKANLEHEKETLTGQIKAINDSLTERVSSLKQEIAAIPGNKEINILNARITKLHEKKDSLGIFKGKEKKALQEYIDQAEEKRNAIQTKMDNTKKTLETRIASVQAEAEKKMLPLQNKVKSINNELTKKR